MENSSKEVGGGEGEAEGKQAEEGEGGAVAKSWWSPGSRASWRGRERRAGRSAGQYKVKMQKLHMSEENPELMKAALLDIRGDLKLRQASMYRYLLRPEATQWLRAEGQPTSGQEQRGLQPAGAG